MQEVCGSWAGRKRLVAVRSGERGVGVGRVVLGQWGTGKRGMWTNGDRVMLWVMVETRVDRAVRFGHGEYQLENRSAQKGSRSAGSGPTRLGWSVSGKTSMTRRRFWSSWVGWRRSTSGSRAALSRFAQRASGAVTNTARRARRRCRACWIAAKPLTAIAELAGVKVSEVRAVLKSAGAQPVAPPDALGAPSAATDAPQSARRARRVGRGWGVARTGSVGGSV